MYLFSLACGDNDMDGSSTLGYIKLPLAVFDTGNCFLLCEEPPGAGAIDTADTLNPLMGAGAVGFVDAFDFVSACHASYRNRI